MIRTLLFVLLLFFLVFVSAQQPASSHPGTLSGTLADARTREPIAFATVTAYRQADTAILSYRLSDGDGKFTLQHLPRDVPAYLVIAFTGYRVERRPFQLPADSARIQLDTILLTADTLTLDEVLIAAERPPVVFRRDTIEFNAESFKTLPSALVEDLLRKLPGVRVDAAGNITVNGKKVNRIMVDGKEFFGSDPKMASRNLSASMIEKVQVTEDKEQADSDPMANASQIGVVVNLKLKKGMKKGWFGKGFAGGGYSAENAWQPYEAGGIVNLYRDTLQVSILGATNNLNRASLSVDDIMSTGGFQRGGASNIWMNDQGNFGVNGVSFGGANQGLNQTLNGGVNMNYSAGKKLDINVRYLAGNQHVQERQRTLSNRFLADTTVSVLDSVTRRGASLMQSAGMEFAWKPDTLTKIEFSPSVTWGNDDVSGQSQSRSHRYQPQDTTELNAFSTSLTTGSHTLTGNLSLWGERKFKKPKRLLNVNTWSSGTWRDQDQLTLGDARFSGGSTKAYDQLRTQARQELHNWSRIRYQEPINDHLLWTIALVNNTTTVGDTVETLHRPSAESPYDQRVDSLSNAMRLTYQANILATSLIWEVGKEKKKVKIQPFVHFQSLRFNNRYQTGGQFAKPYYNILPGLRVNGEKFHASYEIQTENINESDIRPVVDNSNPMYPVYGNTSLQPPLKHQLSLNYFNYNPVKSTNLNYGVWGGVYQRGIAYERSVDTNGYQITRPINAKGMVDVSLWGNYNFPVRFHDSLTTEFQTSAWGGLKRDVLIFNDIRATPWRYSVGLQAGLELRWKEIITFNPEYGFDYTLNTFGQQAFANQTVIWHTVKGNASLRLPKHFLWETSVNYRYTPVPAPGFRQHNTLLTASLSFLFLKEDRGQLKLSAYDLLNQNQGLSRTTSTNEVVYQSALVLRRYVMLTFTYDLRPAGEKKKKGQFWWNW